MRHNADFVVIQRAQRKGKKPAYHKRQVGK